MNDVIIAIVPSPGHEGLTADGPLVAGCRPERPMTIRRCSCGVWGCPSLDGVVVAGVHHATPQTYDVALVLHAPGGPRLGMVRCKIGDGDPTREEVAKFLDDLPVGAMSTEALGIWCFAHLMRVRGFAVEVLVLPIEKPA